jgi:hypothetical protein
MPDHETHDTLPAMSPTLRGKVDCCWLAAAQVSNAREYVDLDALENACWLDAAAMGGAP